MKFKQLTPTEMSPPFNKYEYGDLQRWLEARGFAVLESETHSDLLTAVQLQWELEQRESGK